MTNTFKLKSVIVEEAKAWDGTKWHEGVESVRDIGQRIIEHVNHKRVTKSSILTRTHEVCSICNGRKTRWDSMEVAIVPCEYCLKDSDGNPAGCEPNTASEWEVREE